MLLLTTLAIFYLTGNKPNCTQLVPNSQVVVVIIIYLGEFAKSDFMIDIIIIIIMINIACPHIKQHFLTCRQTVFLFFYLYRVFQKDINLSGVARAPQAPRPRGARGAGRARGAERGPPGPARKK